MVQMMVVLFISFTSIVAVRYINFTSLFSDGSSIKTIKPSALENKPAAGVKEISWIAPDIDEVKDDQILYGRELIIHTSRFFGPNGKLEKVTNGMNCQNCHLEAGTKVFGNNYALVASTYPKFRARSGSIESIEKRVRDCFERSLNGKAPVDSSKEMQAMVAYIKWVGSEVTQEKKPDGTGIFELPVLDRAADPEKGKLVFSAKCVSCHGANGEGVPNSDLTEYTYPPLFGKHSYNSGAGLYRLSRLAGYVKMNMPQGVSYVSPQLTDEEAWDVAAFINTQSRPDMNIQKDWPDISKKPFDHPFGPYADAFSEQQHKLGPFGPIKKAAKK
ncbi:MAG: c-type cytochrome [Bacteroidia bacterium]|nr:c-type cytochrome [Bacteroidia bacterium]MBP7244711.1 c-type cytochrome [Bacteroidia bacterium]